MLIHTISAPAILGWGFFIFTILPEFLRYDLGDLALKEGEVLQAVETSQRDVDSGLTLDGTGRLGGGLVGLGIVVRRRRKE